MTLQAERVVVELAGRRVLDGVDVAVGAGELVALVGPNGAGKTTLLRTLLGLVPADAGQVRIGGRTPDRARAHGAVGYVPQRREVAWSLPIDVCAAVLTGRAGRLRWLRGPRRSDREAAEAAMAAVGIADLARRPLEQLSGGQRQRVLLARALALEPELLLLDEPVTGLDAPSRQDLADVLDRVRRDGTAVLMTTHDLHGAVAACDRLVLLNRRVIAAGAPADLANPAPWLEAFGVPVFPEAR